MMQREWLCEILPKVNAHDSRAPAWATGFITLGPGGHVPPRHHQTRQIGKAKPGKSFIICPPQMG